ECLPPVDAAPPALSLESPEDRGDRARRVGGLRRPARVLVVWRQPGALDRGIARLSEQNGLAAAARQLRERCRSSASAGLELTVGCLDVGRERIVEIHTDRVERVPE